MSFSPTLRWSYFCFVQHIRCINIFIIFPRVVTGRLLTRNYPRSKYQYSFPYFIWWSSVLDQLTSSFYNVKAVMSENRSDCFLPPSLSHDGVVLTGECRSRNYESRPGCIEPITSRSVYGLMMTLFVFDDCAGKC